MSDAARQPMLSAEWLRQPEAIELVQHMAQFAAILMGHLTRGYDPTSPGFSVDAGGNPHQDDSNVPPGAGGALRSYMKDENKAATRSAGDDAGLNFMPYDDQVKYLDGINDGSITQPRAAWQYGQQQAAQNGNIDKQIDVQDNGPDVASAPKGGMRARAE